MSTGLLEAMGYSNCVLVSDIQENLEVIGEGGMSFRTKGVSDLQMKLEILMTHPDLVQTYREKARSSILEKYNWEKIIDQYIELYQSLLA